jgi:hypothetical protein
MYAGEESSPPLSRKSESIGGSLLDDAKMNSSAENSADLSKLDTEGLLEAMEERFAIMEFDGNLSREEAERLALEHYESYFSLKNTI